MNLIIKIENKLQHYILLNKPYTNVIGLSRSFLALGTLLTLLANHSSVIIQKTNGTPLNPLLNPITTINKFNFFLLFGIENFNIMRFIAILLLIIVISGFYIKVSSVLHWWISFSFFLCSSVVDGGDQITTILTLLLIPVCMTDDRKNHWKKPNNKKSFKNVIGVFFIILIRVQIAVIYFHAAVGKFNVLEWNNGTALYYWINHSFFGAQHHILNFLNTVFSDKWLISLSTYGVLVFELGLFLCLSAPIRYRKYILPMAILFHFVIIVFHGIFSFFFAIVAGLILFLYPTNEHIKLKPC